MYQPLRQWDERILKRGSSGRFGLQLHEGRGEDAFERGLGVHRALEPARTLIRYIHALARLATAQWEETVGE